MMLAFCLLIGGVVGAAARNSKAGSIVAAFYLLGAFFGLISGGFGDLVIWTVVSAAFGVFFIVGAIVMKKPKGD